MLSLLQPWNNFFHCRLGSDGCRLCGLIRIGFALLVVVDKLVLALDLDYFMSPTNGIIPRRVALQNPEIHNNMLTLFDLAPESDSFLWAMHWVGLLHAVLLLLGIVPRLQLLGLFVNLVSFQHHNCLIWDGEDCMFRMWCFLLMFFPLHRCTIYDLITKQKSKYWEENSWPMWPIRLFQLEVTYIYLSASVAKLPGGAWIDGTAMYYIIHYNDNYPGIFNPEILFNRVLPLKILCWSSIIVEGSSWILVWIPSCRNTAVIVMVIFHLGIELAMTMHVFEWLAMLGWTVFLLQPDEKENSPPKTSMPSRISVSRLVKDAFIFMIAVMFFIDTAPLTSIHELLPELYQPKLETLIDYRNKIYFDYGISHALNLSGLYQGTWDMYDGNEGADNRSFEASISFKDGSRAVWKSRNWYETGDFERKRYMREMNYDESILSASTAEWSSFCQYLIREVGAMYEKEVSSCELVYHSEEAVPPPEDIGWFEPARQPMTTNRPKTMVIVKKGCQNYHKSCKAYAGAGECKANPGWMEKNCQLSCDVCVEGYHYYWPEKRNGKKVYYYTPDGDDDEDDEDWEYEEDLEYDGDLEYDVDLEYDENREYDEYWDYDEDGEDSEYEMQYYYYEHYEDEGGVDVKSYNEFWDGNNNFDGAIENKDEYDENRENDEGNATGNKNENKLTKAIQADDKDDKM